MTFLQKIVQFFKRKYVWIPLLILSIFLQLVGIMTLIGIHSYQLKPNETLFGAWQYSYELSEKSALDTWKKDTVFYNQLSQDSSAPVKKTFGEFRARVVNEKDQDNKVTIQIKTSHGGLTGGLLYIDGRIYDAELNSQTGDITYDASRSFERPNWQWYDWMGLRQNPLITEVFNILKSGLSR